MLTLLKNKYYYIVFHCPNLPLLEISPIFFLKFIFSLSYLLFIQQVEYINILLKTSCKGMQIGIHLGIVCTFRNVQFSFLTITQIKKKFFIKALYPTHYVPICRFISLIFLNGKMFIAVTLFIKLYPIGYLKINM